jgi:hypothetical protein
MNEKKFFEDKIVEKFKHYLIQFIHKSFPILL